jgi:hypothetical protein
MAAKKSGLSKKLLLILAGLGGLGVFSCVLCGGAGFWALSTGLEKATIAVKNGTQSDPTIEEQIGVLDEINLDFRATVEAQQQYGSKALSFKVSGPKGEGQVIVIQNPCTPGFKEGYLTTDEGEWEIDVSKMIVE